MIRKEKRMQKDSRIYVAGHRGLVGSALCNALAANGYNNIIKINHSELDLTNQALVNNFFEREHPEYVFLNAAFVGGIAKMSETKAETLCNNVQIEMNIMKAAERIGCNKVLFISSACVYPISMQGRLSENNFELGNLEKNNEAYSLSKIVGMKMCEYLNVLCNTRYICVVPTNLYGPNDRFEGKNAHVIPAMIEKFYRAKKNQIETVKCWGDRNIEKDFLFVDDFAKLCIDLMENYEENEFINAGTGRLVSMYELASIVAKTIGYNGTIEWDENMPKGAGTRELDITKALQRGWNANTSLEEGIKRTYEFFLKENRKEEY